MLKLGKMLFLLFIGGIVNSFTYGIENFNSILDQTMDSGRFHTCIITGAENNVKCWGLNQNYQLGNGLGFPEQSYSATPVVVKGIKNARKILMGDQYSCALLQDDTVKCWGIDTNTYVSNSKLPVLMTGMTNVLDVNKNLCTIYKDKSVKCKYHIYDEQLLTYKDITTNINGLENPIQIEGGVDFNCALLANKTVKCWNKITDQNKKGELVNTLQKTTSPVLVKELNNAIKISIDFNKVCALLYNNKVKCWGSDFYATLGRFNSRSDAMVCNKTLEPQCPSNFSIPDYVVNGNQQIEAIDIIAREYNVCAILKDKSLMCWGSNEFGQLGQGKADNSEYNPEKYIIKDVSNINKVSIGVGFICTSQENGIVKCWGGNKNGELGNGTKSDNPILNPTNVINLAINPAELNQIPNQLQNPSSPNLNGCPTLSTIQQNLLKNIIKLALKVTSINSKLLTTTDFDTNGNYKDIANSICYQAEDKKNYTLQGYQAKDTNKLFQGNDLINFLKNYKTSNISLPSDILKKLPSFDTNYFLDKTSCQISSSSNYGTIGTMQNSDATIMNILRDYISKKVTNQMLSPVIKYNYSFMYLSVNSTNGNFWQDHLFNIIDKINTDQNTTKKIYDCSAQIWSNYGSNSSTNTTVTTTVPVPKTTTNPVPVAVPKTVPAVGNEEIKVKFSTSKEWTDKESNIIFGSKGVVIVGYNIKTENNTNNITLQKLQFMTMRYDYKLQKWVKSADSQLEKFITNLKLYEINTNKKKTLITDNLTIEGGIINITDLNVNIKGTENKKIILEADIKYYSDIPNIKEYMASMQGDIPIAMSLNSVSVINQNNEEVATSIE